MFNDSIFSGFWAVPQTPLALWFGLPLLVWGLCNDFRVLCQSSERIAVFLLRLLKSLCMRGESCFHLHLPLRMSKYLLRIIRAFLLADSLHIYLFGRAYPRSTLHLGVLFHVLQMALSHHWFVWLHHLWHISSIDGGFRLNWGPVMDLDLYLA